MEKANASNFSVVSSRADRDLQSPVHDLWQIVDQLATFDDAYYMIRRTFRCPLDMYPSGKHVRFEERWVSLAVMEKSKFGKELLEDWGVRSLRQVRSQATASTSPI